MLHSYFSFLWGSSKGHNLVDSISERKPNDYVRIETISAFCGICLATSHIKQGQWCDIKGITLLDASNLPYGYLVKKRQS